MFGWRKRTKEWPPLDLLDGERMLYTVPWHRYAVTTHRFRVREPLIRFRNWAPGGDYRLEDLSVIAWRRSPFPWEFLMIVVSFFLFGTTHPFFVFSIATFAFCCGFLVLADRFKRERTLFIVHRHFNTYWALRPLYDEDAVRLEQELKSARDARLRALASNEEEDAR